VSDREGPPAVTLATGAEELLRERAVEDVVRRMRAVDPGGDVDVRDVRAADVTMPDLLELTSPSLFGERRVVAIRGLGGKSDDDADDSDPDTAARASVGLAPGVLDLLVHHATEKHPLTAVVVVHEGGNRHRGVVTALSAKDCSAVVVPCKGVVGRKGTPLGKAAGAKVFVEQELSSPWDGGPGLPALDDGVVDAIVSAVGTSLRDLAAACRQLRADLPAGERLAPARVAQQFGGRAEVQTFDIADAVVGGRTSEALRLARHALETGVKGPAITAVVAMGLRNLAKAAAAPRSGTATEQAAAVGMKDFQLSKARAVLRWWTPSSLSRALRAVADADAEVKGAAVHQEFAIDRMLVRIDRARRAG
jgi:DNA polymerase-3 subunit delta